MELLARVKTALGDFPVLSAGGVTDRHEAEARLDAGAEAVVSGTRFLMSVESGAHAAYKERLIGARDTVLTELFGFGWPAPHRVVPNAATDRWLKDDPRGPGWLRGIQRATAPILSKAPVPMQVRMAATQQPGRPVFGPAAATADGPESLVDAGPLYAGECIERIDDIRPAAELVAELSPA
jgi:nitronate monooxygenase